MAPKLIKHSTSYIFLPLFSSLHIHYTILGRKCQEKKGRFLQKNSNKSLDFGSNMCYNGSVYPERNENDSHLGGFWELNTLRPKHFFPDSCFSGDTATAYPLNSLSYPPCYSPCYSKLLSNDPVTHPEVCYSGVICQADVWIENPRS